MTVKFVTKVLAIDHHRNGVSGCPFDIVLFKYKKRRMVGIVLDSTDSCPCVVLDVDLLSQGNIEFGTNSWRGDDFYPELKAIIEKRYEEQ
jgi:hypothetical protein